MKRLVSFVLVLFMLVSSVPLSVSAAGANYCTGLTGTNKSFQDYSQYNYATPITSYMSVCASGELMAVRALTSGVEVAYYNSQYKLTKSLTVKKELPLFGGFYETENNYFILTGQENPNQNNSAEVIRVTKYTKAWKRMGSVSLSGCNTTIPFRAGSARFTHNGNVLVVRTCHQMYRADDGLNHQANMTFSIDIEQMSVINSHDYVHNTKSGYVSHSFNQFIKYVDGSLVAVDHGDAHPRSVCLIKYNQNAFLSKYSTGTNGLYTMLSIPGISGDNYTGVTVGGFDASSAAYVVVGTSELNSKGAHNIYVSTLQKSSSTPSLKYITSYTKGNGSASTPHLIKFSDKYFMVLWENGDDVYYVLLNTKGEQYGSIRKMKGAALSDCTPVVYKGNVTWYTHNENDVTFYSINTSDLTKTSKTTVNNGHKYVYKSDGTYHWQTCSHCLKKTAKQKHTITGAFTQNSKLTTACTVCSRVMKSENLYINMKETFKGGEQSLSLEVKTASGKTLVYDKDFCYWYQGYATSFDAKGRYVEYWSNLYIRGLGKYTGAITKDFYSLNFLGSIADIKTQLHTGKEVKPAVKVIANGKALKNGTDYTVTYKNNVNVGTATVTVTGKGNYFGTLTKTFKIAKSIAKAKVTGLTVKTATGKALYQNPKVVLNGTTLKKGTDYTVSYKNNIKAGKATITITGKGKYTGTVKKTFIIKPAKVTLSYFNSPAKRTAQAAWKKLSGVSGYEITYAQNAAFTKGKKTVTAGYSNSSRKITGLRSKGTYYVKVRAYKIIDGKRCYGAYSAVKKVQVK